MGRVALMGMTGTSVTAVGEMELSACTEADCRRIQHAMDLMGCSLYYGDVCVCVTWPVGASEHCPIVWKCIRE